MTLVTILFDNHTETLFYIPLAGTIPIVLQKIVPLRIIKHILL